MIRKHRIIERLLTDFMGYTAAEAHVHADELGDTFTDDMVERIDMQLGHPDRCPHGWPTDVEFEKEENLHLAPLADLPPGSKATIVRLAEHDGDLLHWFYDQGLAPGTEFELLQSQPAGGQFAVRVDGAEKTMGEKAAQGLYVRAADATRSEAAHDLSSGSAPAARSARPAASRSASALSVRSHVKSASSRPKWPYAAVFA